MKMNGKGEEWDPVDRIGNPCSSPLKYSYLTFISDQRNQVGVQVNQAAPMLERTLLNLLTTVARTGGRLFGSAYVYDARYSLVFLRFLCDS